jgi:opacity protein-like surface antigen
VRESKGVEMKKVLFVIVLLVVLLSACADADVASENVSKAADNFEINRRIVFYNGISGEYILVIEGFCSLGNYDPAGSLSVICKTSPTEYKKHYLGLSDNVTYFAEQIESAQVDAYHYRVFFKPSVIIPDVDFKP